MRIKATMRYCFTHIRMAQTEGSRLDQALRGQEGARAQIRTRECRTLDQAKPTEGRMGSEVHAGCHLHGATMLREQVKCISGGVGEGVLGAQEYLSQ